ncbi:Dihydroorotase [Candidatus Sumerlaea chitinivorans]|uniref:Dihydroorotase n=1 Tax=Sumerlaea chitinivorans TaxID=2250252 RepID=A0A2Z4Y5S0_SUMC1|nr:Dihydroorotase [Candidatus Sumerlaea chitinivorans]
MVITWQAHHLDMARLIIQNGRVLDPATGRDEITSIEIEDGIIREIAPTLPPPDPNTTVIDATGRLVCPGFIDLHTHLREPGREDKETIASGTRAAAAGGFTTVCAIPNTCPIIDSQTGIKFILSRAESDGVVNVIPYASVTRNQQGEEIVEFGDLVSHGARGFTDDGHPIMNAEIMRRALEYSAMFDVPILDHCEDLTLSSDGIMHDGFYSTKLGLKGIPALAESIQVARDVELAAITGGHIHIMHVSKHQSLAHIRRAKAAGIRVTCEVTPHHLTLTDAALETFDTNLKVNPPLGDERDREALIEALADGTIDCIATDHAPHTDIEKDLPIADAPFGMIGLETAFPVLYTKLVCTGKISLPLLIEKLTWGPAQVLGLDPRGTLTRGAPADIVILDLEKTVRFEAGEFFSKGCNSPWIGHELRGSIETTIVAGQIVYHQRKILK